MPTQRLSVVIANSVSYVLFSRFPIQKWCTDCEVIKNCFEGELSKSRLSL